MSQCFSKNLNNYSTDDLAADEDQQVYEINFTKPYSDETRIKISKDNTQIIFSNEGETFLVTI